MANEQNTTLLNFVGGEISRRMAGRVDLDVYSKSLEWCQNFVIRASGGADYRPGKYCVGLTKNNSAARMLPFQFSANDAYVIVMTNQKFRFYRNNGVILKTATNITGITKANPAVLTSVAHGLSNGDEVYVTGVEGMSQVNGRFFLVANKTNDTFEMQDQFAVNINSTAYGTYGSAGTVAAIYELSTPYTEANLSALRQAQTADLMYIAARAYEPRKLVRTAHTSWSINTYVRTNDFIAGANDYPGAVAFTANGRVAFVGSTTNPEGFWASRGPNGAASRYDDFTTGSSALDAAIFNFSPVEGQIDSIQEIKQSGKQLLLLGASSIRRVFGATPEQPVSGLAVDALATIEGSAAVRPIIVGGTMLFVDVNKKKLKGYQYNLAKDDYEARDFNLAAEHFGEESPFKKIVRVKGSPDAVWVLREDGVLLSFTYHDSENIAGWARHVVGAGGTVEDIETIRRDTGEDQLWLIVKRVMGSKTYRSVEVMSAWPAFPERRKFFTGSKAADTTAYENATWEQLKDPSFLDMALTYDGTARGDALSATITPSAVTGDSITITSDNGVFRADQVGQQIWKRYASTGTGGGQATIIEYTSATQVTCKVETDFDSVAAIAPGDWEFAVDTLDNLHLFEGLEVDIQADGSAHPSRTVTAGSITLQNPASRIHVGFIYTGLFITQNIDIGGRIGPANSKPRNLTKLKLRLKDSISCKIGTNEYEVKELVIRKASNVANRVPPPFSGSLTLPHLDRWDDNKKQVCVVHETPAPLTLLGFDPEVHTVDKT